jgi:uncharacterized protein YuzE
MNFHYDRKSDSMYITLSAKTSAESEEVADGIVVDYDDAGHIVGLDIENASQHMDMAGVHFSGFTPSVDVAPNA